MKFWLKYIIVFVVAQYANGAFAQTSAELKQRRAETEKEIEKINQQLAENKSSAKMTSNQIALLNKRIDQRKKLIKDTDIQISIAEKNISEKNAEIDKMKARLDTLKTNFSEVLVNIYTKRKKSTWLMYVFASKDLSQAYRRTKYLQAYTDVVFMQSDKIKKFSEKINGEIVTLNAQKREMQGFQVSRKKDVAQLSNDEQTAKKALAGLKGEESKLRKQMQKQRAALTKINAEIAAVIAREVKKTKIKGSKNYTKTPQNTKLSASFAANQGRLPWPVKQGSITGSFGNHNHPIFKSIKLPPNNGVDISTPDGSTVYSVFEGEVRRVFSIPGMNTCVMVQHGEYYTLYCRLANASVTSGQKIKTGAVIGKAAVNDGSSVLHFELWKGTNKQNPELWLQQK